MLLVCLVVFIRTLVLYHIDCNVSRNLGHELVMLSRLVGVLLRRIVVVVVIGAVLLLVLIILGRLLVIILLLLIILLVGWFLVVVVLCGLIGGLIALVSSRLPISHLN